MLNSYCLLLYACFFPRLQATLAPPVKGKMFKGLSVCYIVHTVTFFSVAISGYWAFGNESEGLILSNFVDNGKPLMPKWFIYMTNIFTIAQLSAVGVVSNTLTLPFHKNTAPPSFALTYHKHITIYSSSFSCFK